MRLQGTKYWSRFWTRIKKTSGCWEWQGAKTTDGYGQLKVYGVDLYVHRLMYEVSLKHNLIPKGMCVLHKCDNPPCVRPDHLVLGSNLQNVQDCVNKGRQSRGASHGLSKLTEAKVRAIRLDHRPDGVIAQEYSVSKATIRRARKRITWKHGS